MHTANPSVELFNDSLRDLKLHFDARRLFGLI
jgi:hypothetical protein